MTKRFDGPEAEQCRNCAKEIADILDKFPNNIGMSSMATLLISSAQCTDSLEEFMGKMMHIWRVIREENERRETDKPTENDHDRECGHGEPSPALSGQEI